MKMAAVFVAALVMLAGCGHTTEPLFGKYDAVDYREHKHTIWIKVNWDYTRPDADTIVAEGYVEPYNKGDGLRDVRLELVGLDDAGEVVNSTNGIPKDTVIISPIDQSPFRITMRLNGREKRFTIRGSYYYMVDEKRGSPGSSHYGAIPLGPDQVQD